MSTNIVLLIIAGMFLVAAMFMYFGYLKIANELFIRLVCEQEDKFDSDGVRKSPYSIKRIYSTDYGRDYYYIYEGKIKVRTPTFRSAKDAQLSMNELEKIGGYPLTEIV